mmetsp:Transcript_50332/g.155967  ORF Transcript_50332/g.155967 Transcript_50332/m.155967 type:complete len:434 (-) Transcript_50332:149-1450(-)
MTVSCTFTASFTAFCTVTGGFVGGASFGGSGATSSLYIRSGSSLEARLAMAPTFHVKRGRIRTRSSGQTCTGAQIVPYVHQTDSSTAGMFSLRSSPMAMSQWLRFTAFPARVAEAAAALRTLRGSPTLPGHCAKFGGICTGSAKYVQSGAVYIVSRARNRMLPCPLSGRRAPVTLAGSNLHLDRSRSSGNNAMLKVTSKVFEKRRSPTLLTRPASLARWMIIASGTKRPPQKAWCSKPILKLVLPWSKTFTRRSTPDTSRRTKRTELGCFTSFPSAPGSRSAARRAPEFRPSSENWTKGSTAFVPSSRTKAGSGAMERISASRHPRKPLTFAGGAGGSSSELWGWWASWHARYHQRSHESPGLLAATSSALPRSPSSSFAIPPTKSRALFSWPSRKANEAFAILCRRPRTEEMACRAMSPSDRSSGDATAGRS